MFQHFYCRPPLGFTESSPDWAVCSCSWQCFAPSQRLPTLRLAYIHPPTLLWRVACRSRKLSSKKKKPQKTSPEVGKGWRGGGRVGWEWGRGAEGCAAVPVTVPWWARGGWPRCTRDKVVQRLPPSSVRLCQARRACPRAGWEDKSAQQGPRIERRPFKITYG